MDDKNRQKILNILGSIQADNTEQVKGAAQEMAKTTKIMLDAFENEGVDHYDAMSIICAIFTGAVMGKGE